MILTPNGFCKSLRVPSSWCRLPLPYPSISDMDGRSLFCTRHLLSRRISLLGPSAFLQPPFRLARPCFLSMKLTVWSSYFQSLSLVCRRNLLVEKTKQKRVYYRGWSYVLLKRLWQDGRLAHFLLWGFGWFWPLGRLPFSLLDQGILHPFALALIVSIHLVSNDVRVVVNDYACASRCFGKVEACY